MARHYQHDKSKAHKLLEGIREVAIAGDTASADAFGRGRVSTPTTIFDSKQLFDNQPLFWDDQETSGSGTSSSHSVNEAATTISVGASTAGTRVRQTFMRFNYQPGKSQLIFLTGILGTGESGITQRIGLFDENNGLIFNCEDGTMKVTRRTNVTGTPADTDVNQANWNIDKMDGNGPSTIELDFTKTQIFVIDFEWLGVGRVRMGFVIDGRVFYCHEFLNTNVLDKVYMSTPNLPLRYEISNDGTGGASSTVHICATVISEGGQQDTGILHYASTNGTAVTASSLNSVYAIIGFRLKAGYIGESIDFEQISIQIQSSSDQGEWTWMLNPTVAGTFTYSDHTNSGLQIARGATANTVTGGTPLSGGFAESDAGGQGSGGTTLGIPNALRLGSAIDGTVDEMVLCWTPRVNTNHVIEGGVVWRELS